MPLLKAYRFISHPPIDVATKTAKLIVSDGGKDLIALWLFLGGATTRLATIYYRKLRAVASPIQAAIHKAPWISTFNRTFQLVGIDNSLAGLVAWPWIPVFWLCCVVFWPIMLMQLLRRPVFSLTSYNVAGRWKSILEQENALRIGVHRQVLSDCHEYWFDLRVVLLLQSAAVLSCVALFTIGTVAGY